jgi:hypothetical protein
VKKKVPYNFSQDAHYHPPSMSNQDIQILKNLTRRPMTLKQIKNNYKPVYNNAFGKVKVDPTKKTFFQRQEY